MQEANSLVQNMHLDILNKNKQPAPLQLIIGQTNTQMEVKMWSPLHKFSCETELAVKWCAKHRLWGTTEELERLAHCEGVPLEALDEINAHPYSFLLAVSLYPIRVRAWTHAWNWMIGILAILGISTLSERLGSALDPVVGKEWTGLIFLILGMSGVIVFAKAKNEKATEVNNQ